MSDIAASHNYLGNRFEYQENFRETFDTGESINIPLILFNKIVLFPGDTLPLRIQKHMNVNLYEHLRSKLISKSLKVVGIVTKWPKTTAAAGVDFNLIRRMVSENESQMLGSYGIPSIGITVEIVSWSLEADDEIIIMGKGRQRFSIIGMSSRNRVPFGDVLILNDDEPMSLSYFENSYLLGNRSSGVGDSAISAALNPFPQWVSDAKCPLHLAAQAYQSYLSSLEWRGDTGDEEDEEDEMRDSDNDSGNSNDNNGDDQGYYSATESESETEPDSNSGFDIDTAQSAVASSAGAATVVPLTSSGRTSDAPATEPDSSVSRVRMMQALIDLFMSTATTSELRAIQRQRLVASGDYTDGAVGPSSSSSSSSSSVKSSRHDIDSVRRMWGCGSDDKSDIHCSGDLNGGSDGRSPEMESTRHLNAVRFPVRFSYYLSTNLPLSDEEKLELLAFPSVELRLRKLIEYMRSDMDSVLVCCRCRSPLANRCHIFSVPGADGTVGAYVNPHGVVHQTITIRQLASRTCYILDGNQATAQDTWFPGYGWIIAYCSRCYNHLGWKFVRVGSVSNGTDLEDNFVAGFWGIRRGAVSVQRKNTDDSGSSS